MQEFDYLLKKRSKALGLFHKVIAKLSAVQTEINALIAESRSEIDRMHKELDEHTKKIQFLDAELETTILQRANIEKLLQ